MPNDAHTLLIVIRVVLAIAAIATTIFPVLYFFSPWWRSHLGRAVMLEALSIAFAIDITAYAQFFRTTNNIWVIFWVNLSFLVFISLASLYLTAALLYYNFRPKKENTNV